MKASRGGDRFRLIGLVVALGSVLWLRSGNADLAFEAPVTFPASNAYVVASLDFDGLDGLDLLVLQEGEGLYGDSALVLLNDGFGAFHPGTAFRCSLGLVHATAADLDRQGPDDMVIVSTHGDVLVVLNGPSGMSATPYQVILSPGYTEAVDIDQDGDLDLAIAVPGSGGIKFLVNNGSGGFTLGQKLTGISGISQISAADFNEDGNVDLVVSSSSSRLNVLYGDGAGTFTRTWFSWSSQGGIAAADFDLDGHADIATRAGTGLWLLWGNGQGGFNESTSVTSFSDGWLTVDDWNRDGLPDLVQASYFADRPHTFVENLGGRMFAPEPYDLGGFGAANFASGDFDGDGWPDLAAGSGGPSFVSVLRNANAPTASVEPLPSASKLSVAPNPAVRRFAVSFELAGTAPAMLELWDVQGRRVDRRQLGSFGPGRHQVTLGDGVGLAPGMYLVRLVQGERAVTARACLIE